MRVSIGILRMGFVRKFAILVSFVRMLALRLELEVNGGAVISKFFVNSNFYSRAKTVRDLNNLTLLWRRLVKISKIGQRLSSTQ